MVRYASLVSQERRRRGGAGAVFSAGLSKGWWPRAHTPLPCTPQEFRALNRRWVSSCRPPITGHRLPQLGTPTWCARFYRLRLLGHQDYARGAWDQTSSAGETPNGKILVTNRGCPTCPIQCGRVVMVDGSGIRGRNWRPSAFLGSNLLNNDLKASSGQPPLRRSTASTILFLRHCRAGHGLNEGACGTLAQFGDAGRWLELVELVAYGRESAQIAQGTRRLSQK